MPDTTPIYSLPYGTLTDGPVDLLDVSELALAVETVLQTAVVSDATGTAGNIEIVMKMVNAGNCATQDGNDITVTGITGLVAGDYCLFIGGALRSQLMRTETICSTSGQILVHQFNTDNVDVNMGSVPFYFLIIHHT